MYDFQNNDTEIVIARFIVKFCVGVVVVVVVVVVVWANACNFT